jgi:hypothetical protein
MRHAARGGTSPATAQHVIIAAAIAQRTSPRQAPPRRPCGQMPLSLELWAGFIVDDVAERLPRRCGSAHHRPARLAADLALLWEMAERTGEYQPGHPAKPNGGLAAHAHDFYYRLRPHLPASEVLARSICLRGLALAGRIVVVTDYAFDESRRLLIRTWDTGVGRVADTATELPQTSRYEDVLGLADALTRLSSHLWRTYTHPASAADSLEVNTEGWRRQGERDAFTTVITALKQPNLPQDGYMIQSYVRVEEAAHRVGRALHELDDTTLTERVVADVEAELAAVEHAERGDLSGRAKQAVLLTRADASPLQVNAANVLFRTDPLGSDKLLHEVDPTAAPVAAAHWLQAAADITAEMAECDPTQVILEADDIEALAVETPTRVLERLNAGETPREVVLDLITSAMTAAEGRIADPGSLPGIIETARQWEQHSRPGEEDPHATLQPRISLLDPARPTHDLLEDLLDGIRGCLLLYREYADQDDLDDEDFDEATADELNEQLDTDFYAAVRAEAEANQDRLL